MRANELQKKPKSKNGQGQTKLTKHIILAADVAARLKRIKDEYSSMLGVSVTYENMLTRWMNHLGRIDADIVKSLNSKPIKETQLTVTAPVAPSKVAQPSVTPTATKAKEKDIEESDDWLSNVEDNEVVITYQCQQILNTYSEVKEKELSEAEFKIWNGKFAVRPDGYLFPILIIHGAQMVKVDDIARKQLHYSSSMPLDDLLKDDFIVLTKKLKLV